MKNIIKFETKSAIVLKMDLAANQSTMKISKN